MSHVAMVLPKVTLALLKPELVANVPLCVQALRCIVLRLPFHVLKASRQRLQLHQVRASFQNYYSLG